MFDQRRVAVVTRGHLRQLADNVVKGGGVGVVVRGLDANNDIALLHPALQTAGTAGVDDAGRLIFFQQHGGGNRGVHLADAALRQQHRFAGEDATGDGDVRDLLVLRLLDAALQQGDFLFHRADDGDRGGFWHHILGSV